MQTKLEAGRYPTLESFRDDILLVTRNAQYYNTLQGPSAIIHTEAKRLEEWGLKMLAREAPAVEENAPKPEPKKEEASPRSIPPAGPVKKASRLNIKLKKQPSMQSSATATPRTATPSRLQHEIKAEDASSDSEDQDSQRANSLINGVGQSMQSKARRRAEGEEDEDEDDDEDDEDAEDDDEEDDNDDDEESDDEDEDEDDEDDGTSSSRRGTSLSVDDASTPGARASPSASKPQKKKQWRRNKAKKKQQQRQSVIAALLTKPTGDDKEDDSATAPVSSTSAAVAAHVPLHYRADGAVDLDRLMEDEKCALLRASGLDAWPNVLPPFIEAITPLHTELLQNAASHAKEIRDTLDGFGAVLAPHPLQHDATHTYDLGYERPPDQRKYPFAIAGGWMFRQKASDLPLAWPRPAGAIGGDRSSGDQQQGGGGATSSGARGQKNREREREREKEEIGLTNLDDWTYSRPHQVRLIEARDLGTYPGLLPAAWVHHIAYQKGGPGKSRLPPHYLAVGSAFENAILDELASMPNRVLLSSKPGILSSSTALPAPSPLDVATAIELAADRDWSLNREESKKAGVRGTDILRETVYGGALGDAYASSIENFVCGAAEDAEESYEAEQSAAALNAAKEASPTKEVVASGRDQEAQGPQSYFDENGEMYNVEAYIGVDFVPLEVRKEAGMVANTGAGTGASTERASPTPAATPPADEVVSYKRMRTTSRYMPNKRRALEAAIESPRSSSIADAPAGSMQVDAKEETNEVTADGVDGDEEHKEEEAIKDAFRFGLDDEASAFLRGSVLDRPLVDHVKEEIIGPLTGGLLRVLDAVSQGIWGEKESDVTFEEDYAPDPMSIDNISDAVNTALIKSEDGSAILSGLPLSHSAAFAREQRRAVQLVRRLVSREYYRAKAQMVELSRAQTAPIQLDGLVRGKDDLVRDGVDRVDPTFASSLLHGFSSTPMDPRRLHDSLKQCAIEAVALSEALAAAKGKAPATTTDAERLDNLRIAYVSLAHRVPQREFRKGHWTTRIENMRKEDMRSQQAAARAQAQARAQIQAHAQSHPQYGGGAGFPMMSPGMPGLPSYNHSMSMSPGGASGTQGTLDQQSRPPPSQQQQQQQPMQHPLLPGRPAPGFGSPAPPSTTQHTVPPQAIPSVPTTQQQQQQQQQPAAQHIPPAPAQSSHPLTPQHTTPIPNAQPDIASPSLKPLSQASPAAAPQAGQKPAMSVQESSVSLRPPASPAPPADSNGQE